MFVFCTYRSLSAIMSYAARFVLMYFIFHDDKVLEFVRDGDKSVAELMDVGRQLLGRYTVHERQMPYGLLTYINEINATLDM